MFTVGSVNEAHLAPLVANLVVAVALVGLVLYARTRINLDMAYRIVVPVIVVLFAVLPFFWEQNPVALNIIMSASYGVFDVIIWSLVAAASYDFAVSGYVLGGIVRSLFRAAAPHRHRHRLSGHAGSRRAERAHRGRVHRGAVRAGDARLVQRAAPQAPCRTTLSPSLEEGAAILSHFDAAAGGPSATQDDARRAEQDAEDDAEEGARDEKGTQELYAAFAEDYGLTRREAEVLSYLARGRSAKVIADALFVSESTVRTHIRRILEIRPTCIRGTLQVIDLIKNTISKRRGDCAGCAGRGGLAGTCAQGADRGRRRRFAGLASTPTFRSRRPTGEG